MLNYTNPHFYIADKHDCQYELADIWAQVLVDDIDIDFSTLLPGSYIFDQPSTTLDQWIRMTFLTMELASGRLSNIQKDAHML